MIASFIAFLGKILLLVLAIVVFKRSVDLSNLKLGGVLDLVVATIVVVGLIVVAATPKLRHGLAARLRSPIQQFRDAMVTVKQPRNFLRALKATIGTEVLFAPGIVLSVQTLGGSVDLGQAIFINITVSLFAGLTPVPGGVGVQEAGLTAGLVGVGVTSAIGVPAVLLYRMMSYYPPPIRGWSA